MSNLVEPKPKKKATPRKRKQAEPVFMDRAKEQTMYLLIPVKTYGTEEQLDQAAHTVVKNVALITHSEVAGVTPDGRKITYNHKGGMVSWERIDGLKVAFDGEGNEVLYDGEGNLVVE